MIRYAGTNEIDLRWIAWSKWTYTSHPVKGLYVMLQLTKTKSGPAN